MNKIPWLFRTDHNQVQSNPGASSLFAGVEGQKLIGGHILAHTSTTRVLLRKGREEERSRQDPNTHLVRYSKLRNWLTTADTLQLSFLTKVTAISATLSYI